MAEGQLFYCMSQKCMYSLLCYFGGLFLLTQYLLLGHDIGATCLPELDRTAKKHGAKSRRVILTNMWAGCSLVIMISDMFQRLSSIYMKMIKKLLDNNFFVLFFCFTH